VGNVLSSLTIRRRSGVAFEKIDLDPGFQPDQRSLHAADAGATTRARPLAVAALFPDIVEFTPSGESRSSSPWPHGRVRDIHNLHYFIFALGEEAVVKHQDAVGATRSQYVCAYVCRLVDP